MSAEANGLGHVLRLRLADRGRRPAPRRLERVRQGPDEAAWQHLNRRRGDLIEKKYAAGLTEEEQYELTELQRAWGRKVEAEVQRRREHVTHLPAEVERLLHATHNNG